MYSGFKRLLIMQFIKAIPSAQNVKIKYIREEKTIEMR